MEEKKTGLSRWDAWLDDMGERLREKNVAIPTEIIGAVLFMALAILMMVIMPQQVAVSEADVIDGRRFPTLLLWMMILCCGILLIQSLMRVMQKKPVQTCTLNLLTEVKALIILAILFITYLICRITDLFVLGGLFCSVGFLLFFRCRSKLYYGITLGMAVLIWIAFRFGLGVRF